MLKFLSTRQEENTFVAKLKLSHYYSYRDKLISIINKYLLECYGEVNYKIEYESSNTIILNFGHHTDTANCVSRFIKIMKLEYIEFYKLVCNLNIKIINSYNNFLSQKKRLKKLNSIKLPGIHKINTDDSLKKIIISPQNIISKSIKKLPSINKSVDSVKISSIDYDNLTYREKKSENKIIKTEKDILSEIEKTDKKFEIQSYNNKKTTHIKRNSWLIQNRIQQNQIESNVLQINKFEKEFSDKYMNNTENEKNNDKENIKGEDKENNEDTIKITEVHNN